MKIYYFSFISAGTKKQTKQRHEEHCHPYIHSQNVTIEGTRSKQNKNKKIVHTLTSHVCNPFIASLLVSSFYGPVFLWSADKAGRIHTQTQASLVYFDEFYYLQLFL